MAIYFSNFAEHKKIFVNENIELNLFIFNFFPIFRFLRKKKKSVVLISFRRYEMFHKNMYSNLISNLIYVTCLHLECANGLTTFTIKSVSIQNLHGGYLALIVTFTKKNYSKSNVLQDIKPVCKIFLTYLCVIYFCFIFE